MRRRGALDEFLAGVRATGRSPRSAAMAAALAVARRNRCPIEVDADAPLDVPIDLCTPDLPGHVYEALLDRDARRRAGAFYTPPAIADGVVRAALHGAGRAVGRVCDPAAGSGAFLLAAARALVERGADRHDAVRHRLFAIDVDADALAVAAVSLALWSWDGTRCTTPDPGNLVVGDALHDRPHAGSFDLVVGNPPFLGQLAAATARSRDDAAELRRRHGDVAHGYADTAALFLLAALDLAAPGGRVALIQPLSFLSARDAGPIRRTLLERAALAGLWVTTEPVFAASVRVCAPVLAPGAPQADVARWVGPAFEPAPPTTMPANARTWAPLAAVASGVPDVDLTPPTVGHDRSLSDQERPAVRGGGRRAGIVGQDRSLSDQERPAVARTVGDLATATAGFRDEYYGLVGHVVEDGDGPRLVTSGLVDPAVCHWGRRPAQFARQRWHRPTVDVDGLEPRVAAWDDRHRVPKLLVATQTRVVEVAVDEDGVLLPSVPVIAVHPATARLWDVAAALSAPPVTAWALRTYGGAALTADAVKLAARQVLEVPLPGDGDAWRRGAERFHEAAHAPTETAWRAAMSSFGKEMNAAYGASDDVLHWWEGRLPGWR
jgi:hypothetical protein